MTLLMPVTASMRAAAEISSGVSSRTFCFSSRTVRTCAVKEVAAFAQRKEHKDHRTKQQHVEVRCEYTTAVALWAEVSATGRRG